MYKVETHSKRRTVVTEISYPNADLTKCPGPGVRYPDGEARMGQMHSMQSTERFVIVAENSYLWDPCAAVHPDDTQPQYRWQFSYEEGVQGRIYIVNKNGDHEATLRVRHMFITHVLGSYEDTAANKLVFDVLQYKDASPYDHWADTDVITGGERHPDNFTEVMRYTVDMETWTLDPAAPQNLIKADITYDFEFSNINPAYYTKPYKYGYMTHNVFNLHGSTIKLNVEDGSIIKKELPDGMFPTEPIFVAAPGSAAEDDGVILMPGVDGGKEKGFIMIYNATTMEVLYQGLAPKMSLFGLHSKFYPFHVGCSQNDCTPETKATTTTTTTTESGQTDQNSVAAMPVFTIIHVLAIVTVAFF